MGATTEGRALLAAANAKGSSWRDWMSLTGWLDANAPAMLDALDAVERVRQLHRPGDAAYGPEWNRSTRHFAGCARCQTPYPCMTALALDDDRDE